MENLIKRIIEEETGLKLQKIDRLILSKIHEKKKELRTKENIINYLKETLKFWGMSPNKALLYYYLFTLNYDKDGNYNSKSPDDFLTITELNPAKISNIKASDFVDSTLPFRGSNLDGFWEKDSMGTYQYVVTSYRWYPIFIFKDGIWYGNTNPYSSSTSKQMSNARPEGQIKSLTKREIELLRSGRSYDKIIGTRPERFVDSMKNELKDKRSSIKVPNTDGTMVTVNFIIRNLELVGNQVEFDIEVTSLKNSNGEKVNQVEGQLNDNIVNQITRIYQNKFRDSLLGNAQTLIKIKYR